VHYQRGPDMGGGVGGLLYSLRDGAPKFNLSNGRGDIVAQSDSTGALTWTASYEAYGKRTRETGTNADKQRANSKDEDPTGLLNEGFRYRDIETGVWLSRDPAGFVDGPNLYAYVKQNPWTKFDPDGLAEKEPLSKTKEARLYHVTADPKHPDDLTKIKYDLVTDYSEINRKNSARIWINGMANTERPASELGVKHTGWTDFYMVHNPSQGGWKDFGECAWNALHLPSKVVKSTADLLSKFELKTARIVSHSQGTMIMNQALTNLDRRRVDMKGVQLSYHNSAANYFASKLVEHQIGGRIIEFGGHPGDPVHNIIGMNTLNPARIVGSIPGALTLADDTRNWSLHSLKDGGPKASPLWNNPLMHPLVPSR
jgi:RHS repeat-associated protein